ncbi:MAG: glycosyltransferase family 4 protein [Candidatus Omnitrophota bacterium]
MNKIAMLLTNAFMPDPRPFMEALSLSKAGYPVKILCWDRGEGLPGRELINGIEIERIRLKSTHGAGNGQAFFLAILWLKMLWRLRKEKCDIVYCHDFDTLPVGILMKFFAHKKTVFDSHEVYSKMLGAKVFAPLKAFVGWMEKRLIGLSDAVIVTCENMGQLYSSYGVRAPEIVGNWKNVENFTFPPSVLEEEKARLGIKNELVISYIGNLGPERIIEPLLEAALEDSSIFLIIGGDGPKAAIVRNAAGRRANIIYLGHVRYEKLPLLTALSDAVYYGYERSHSMSEFNAPNKLFEALAAGRAFVGGDFGQMGKVLKEELCGIALDRFTVESVKNAIAVLKDKGRLEGFKSKAMEAALKKYNWHIAEKRLLKKMSELTGGA